MDRFEAMSILLRVVEKGSFSAASRDLRIPLATVSRKVGELEAHLGSKLLTRSTRKLALTDAGAVYLASVKRILEEVDEAEQLAAGEFHMPRGELILTAPVLFGRLHILPVVTDFLAAYPEIDVRLTLSDRNLHLIDDHIDMAVRIGRLPDTSLVATRIGAVRSIVCASPDLLARYGTPRSPTDLARWPCVNFDFFSPAPAWPFRQRDTEATFDMPIHPRLSVSTAEAAVTAATEGVGATRVLHYQCAEALERGSLKIVLADFELDPLPIHLLHAGRAALPSKTRVFLDFATVRLRHGLKHLLPTANDDADEE
jgi:DNA-binding transcriptional LysR family regulator